MPFGVYYVTHTHTVKDVARGESASSLGGAGTAGPPKAAPATAAPAPASAPRPPAKGGSQVPARTQTRLVGRADPGSHIWGDGAAGRALSRPCITHEEMEKCATKRRGGWQR